MKYAPAKMPAISRPTLSTHCDTSVVNRHSSHGTTLD